MIVVTWVAEFVGENFTLKDYRVIVDNWQWQHWQNTEYIIQLCFWYNNSDSYSSTICDRKFTLKTYLFLLLKYILWFEKNDIFRKDKRVFWINVIPSDISCETR